MFTDISLSADLNNKFNNYLKQESIDLGKLAIRKIYIECVLIACYYIPVGINLSIKVLQAGAWPLGPTQVVIPFAVPQEFEKAIRSVMNCIVGIKNINLKTEFVLFDFSLRSSITIRLVDANLLGYTICVMAN